MFKKPYIHYCMLAFLIFFANSGVAQVYNTEIAAEIILDRNSEFVDITGSGYNKSQISRSLNYILNVYKSDDFGNVSNNEQNGRFVLQPGEKKRLSTTTINIDDGNKVIILLRIYDLENNLLGKDRIVLNDDSGDKKIVLKPQENTDVRTEFAKSDGVELRGIVLEDTKTKPGRDFYSQYYSGYLAANIDGPKIVTIKEVLAIANNTKIEVRIDEEVIMEFFIRPQNDYISGMVEIALRRTLAYFDDLEKQNDIVKQYK